MRLHARRLRLAVLLALPAFVAAHDLIFLITYGARNVGTALSRGGHGAQWMATVVSAAMTATVFLGMGAWRLVALAREARDARRSGAEERAAHSGSFSTFAREVLVLWFPVFLGAIAMFVTAENIEHMIIGQPAPGMAVLASAAYLDAPLVLALVSGLVALIAALYAWERDILVREITSWRSRWAPRPKGVAPAADPFPHRRSLSGVRLAGRAPPDIAHAVQA